MRSRKKKRVPTQFHTVKRIDNSRLVRNVEPVRLRGLYRTAGIGALVAVFFMMYIYQHFHCIDLSFQLEDLRAKQTQFTAFNSELRLEIERLRDPRRIDVIARRQLGLTQPLPTQVQEYDAPNGSEVAAARYTRPDREQ
jgi:cell division protein FtsL